MEEVEGEAANGRVVRRRRPRRAALRLNRVHQIEQIGLGGRVAAVPEAGAHGEHAKMIRDGDRRRAKLLGAVEVRLQVRECWRRCTAHAGPHCVNTVYPL